MRPIAVLALAPLLAGATDAASVLDVDLEGVRNARGAIHACLTQRPDHFPDCKDDPQALTLTVPADARSVRFTGFAPGRYALTLFHDENSNRRLDTVLGIPREGFGFSRNPPLRMRAPRFEETDMELGAGVTRLSVRLRYLL